VAIGHASCADTGGDHDDKNPKDDKYVGIASSRCSCAGMSAGTLTGTIARRQTQGRTEALTTWRATIGHR
jgi:hypothetical protein